MSTMREPLQATTNQEEEDGDEKALWFRFHKGGPLV